MDYPQFFRRNQNLIINLLNEGFNKTDTLYRIKSKNSCVEKLNRKYEKDLMDESLDKVSQLLTDLIGLRVICMYESEIDKIAKLLEEEFDLIDKTDKTKELMENDNAFGYKSLHLDIKLNKKRSSLSEYKIYKDLQFEIQIRTIIQNAWSELDHQIKYKKHIPKLLGRRINRLAALFEIADTEFESIDKVSKDLQNSAETNTELMKQDKTSTRKKTSNIPINETMKLDIFTFLALLKKFFKDVYQSFAVESLLDDILNIDINYNSVDIHSALDAELPKVENYIKSKNLDFSFLTKVRHALYLADKAKFSKLIYPDLKKQIDDWLESR